MTVKISSQDYNAYLKTGQLPGTGSSSDKLPGTGSRRTPAIREEDDLEKAIISFLELHKWRVTHHEPWNRHGPPFDLTPRNEKASTILGALTRLGVKVLPRLYLPVIKTREVDRAWPDLICVHPEGHTILIEVKRSKGWRYRPGQREFLATYPKSACLVSSLDELLVELKKRGLPGQDARM